MIGLQRECCKNARVETKLPCLFKVCGFFVFFLHPGHLTPDRELRGHVKFQVTLEEWSQKNSRGVCVDLFTVRVFSRF